MSDPATAPSARGVQHAPEGAGDAPSVRAHLLERIAAAQPGTEPYRHLYIENVLPDGFYELIRAHMLAAKALERSKDWRQDNPGTQRFNLLKCEDPVIATLRGVLSDHDVIAALIAKFYLDPSAIMQNGLVIHHRFEYMFTKSGRIQDIHVDIPPKYLSLVFYIPERTDMTEDEELTNGTILYGRDLQPRPSMPFRKNAVCVFAPHFRTYHGYAASSDRDALVMFYSNPAELKKWQKMRLAKGDDEAPFEGVRDLIEDKLRRHPLIEIGRDQAVLRRERDACRINAPQGAVLKDAS
jgi:hypothetical protein